MTFSETGTATTLAFPLVELSWEGEVSHQEQTKRLRGQPKARLKLLLTASSLGKNERYGPNSVNDDAAALNLFNHAQFLHLDNLLEDSTFGQSLSTITHPDGTTSAGQIQVALKLMF